MPEVTSEASLRASPKSAIFTVQETTSEAAVAAPPPKLPPLLAEPSGARERSTLAGFCVAKKKIRERDKKYEIFFYRISPTSPTERWPLA